MEQFKLMRHDSLESPKVVSGTFFPNFKACFKKSIH